MMIIIAINIRITVLIYYVVGEMKDVRKYNDDADDYKYNDTIEDNCEQLERSSHENKTRLSSSLILERTRE